jgi:hypothetical protein
MWRNVVEPEAAERRIIYGLRPSWWITMSTDTSSVCVIHTDFQWQTLSLGGVRILILYVHCPSCWII